MSPSISRRQILAGAFAVALAGKACLLATPEDERERATSQAASASPGANPFPLIGDIAERTW
jgi:hypothetical protein